MRHSTFLTLLVLVISALAMPLHAADDKKSNRDREQVRRLQQSLQQAQQEKTSLEMEKSAVEEKLKTSGEKIQILEKSVHRAAALARQLSALEQEKAALTARLTESEKRVAQLDEAQKKSLAENVQLQSTIGRQSRELAAGETKNVQLYTYSLELLEKYRNKGILTSMAQSEPLTGLKRIEIDNLLEEYRDKLDAQKIEAPSR